MRISRQQWYEIAGALVALAVAYAGIAFGLIAFGRAGVVLLVISVPAGVLIGWLLAKALDFVARMISESD